MQGNEQYESNDAKSLLVSHVNGAIWNVYGIAMQIDIILWWWMM